MSEAFSKTGVPNSAICEVCKKNRRSAHGYIWLYKDSWDGNPPTLRQHKLKGKPSNNKK